MLNVTLCGVILRQERKHVRLSKETCPIAGKLITSPLWTHLIGYQDLIEPQWQALNDPNCFEQWR